MRLCAKYLAFANACIYEREFVVCFGNYRSASKDIDWREAYPELASKPKEYKIDLLTDLWECDMGAVLKTYFIKVDPEKLRFGYLPKMATTSEGSMGSLRASSFCERIISAANLILTKGNTVLSPEMINMCVVLRMNRRFMNWMRENHPELAMAGAQKHNITVVPAASNLQESDDL